MTPDPNGQAARDRLAQTLLMLAPMLWPANMLVALWSAHWFPPHPLAYGRQLVALAPMLMICGAVLWRRRADVLAEWRDLLLGALGMWVCGAFVYIATASISETNIGLIYAGVPVLVMLLSAAIFSERLRAVQVAGAAVGLAGVLAIIVRGDARFLLGLEFTVGDLWALTAVMAREMSCCN